MRVKTKRVSESRQAECHWQSKLYTARLTVYVSGAPPPGTPILAYCNGTLCNARVVL